MFTIQLIGKIKNYGEQLQRQEILVWKLTPQTQLNVMLTAFQH